MLIVLNITSRDKSTKATGNMVWNTDYLVEITTSGIGSRVVALGQPERQKGSRDVLTCSNTVAEIRNAINTAYAANAITLRVFPDQNPLLDSVYTVFNTAEIIRAWPDATDFNTYMEVNHKGSVKRYLIDHYMYELVNYAETNSTSTYTTYTV